MRDGNADYPLDRLGGGEVEAGRLQLLLDRPVQQQGEFRATGPPG
jgi:hypothetical protein